MKFAHQRSSPTKHKNNSNGCLSLNHTNYKLLSQRTFVHYNNGIYMGSMISYKRNGNGIILLDDGTSLISEYSFDTMTGHNIIFRQNCIMSILFIKNNMYEIVIRRGKCIVKIPFYEGQNLPNGNGILIDYELMKLYHIVYKNGRLIKKIVESDKKILNKIYEQNLSIILDERHQKVLKLNIRYMNGIKMIKDGKKLMIGYFDEKNYLDGMCIKLKMNEQYDNFQQCLQLRYIQRGIYIRNRLQNYGQRYFSNGNYYIGQFQDDRFNGNGILLYPYQQKWVYGQFLDQKLKKIIDINIKQKPIQRQFLKKYLQYIHENNSTNWIGNNIQIFDWLFINSKINQIIDSQVTDIVIQKQKILKDQQQRLNKIQQYFSKQQCNKKVDKLMQQQINKNRISKQKVIISELNNSKVKYLQIQPCSYENKEYWSKQIKYKYSPSKILTPTHSNLQNQVSLKIFTPRHQSRFSPNKLKNSKINGFSSPNKKINKKSFF